MTDDVRVRFVLGALATWRVSHLLACEDGPGDAVLRLRARVGSGQLGKLMDCFACTSVWVAAPMTIAVTRRRDEAAVTWLALSGAACLLQSMAERHNQSEGGTHDGMLWPGPGGAETGADER